MDEAGCHTVVQHSYLEEEVEEVRFAVVFFVAAAAAVAVAVVFSFVVAAAVAAKVRVVAVVIAAAVTVESSFLEEVVGVARHSFFE